MSLFLIPFASGAAFLLSFLLFFHPLRQNIKANQWLGFFVSIIGFAFISTYLLVTGKSLSHDVLFKFATSLQFLLAPALYISVIYFAKPAKSFSVKDLNHFTPFFIYSLAEMIWLPGKQSISTRTLFQINDRVSFLVRDLLPFLLLFYLARCYLTLLKHRLNVRLISATTERVDLGWLMQFLFILLVTVIIWINDAFFELPLLTGATPFVYAGSLFFLAYFAIRQQTIFPYGTSQLLEISQVFEVEQPEPSKITGSEKPAAPKLFSNPVLPVNSTSIPLENDDLSGIALKEKTPASRLTGEQITTLSAKLIALMEHDRLFLDNNLNLPAVAEKLGISIHESSFLVNKTTGGNFYHFINTYRVEEAKKLIGSARIDELNMLGIAFASGFNSKTTFNTTFKKFVGISPTGYSKQLKNSQESCSDG